jgi:hypothetical protein
MREGRVRRGIGLVGVVLATGVIVALGARWAAGGACPHSSGMLGASSCEELVDDLAWRVGAAAALAVVFMSLLGRGLLRTWSSMEHRSETSRER